jgi:NADH-quinone oxidoreductase subunit M
VSFVVTLPLVTAFDKGTAAMQFQEKAPWIERFNVNYHLGVDGLSVWFVLLTAFITGHRRDLGLAGHHRARQPVHGRVPDPVGPAGRRVLRDRRLAVLRVLRGDADPDVPDHRVWGGPRRVYAAFKFFLYTLAGSLLMLVALIYLYYKSGGSFDILTWHRLPLSAHVADAAVLRVLLRLSPSRCRCGRSTPGCPMRTSRRRPAARSCWPRSC